MRKIAMLFAALSLSYATGAMAQNSSAAAPQPGLPPGASVGAPNAVQPSASGDLSTTRVGPRGSTGATAATPGTEGTDSAMPMTHRTRHHRRHHGRRHHAAAPAATDSAAPAQ